MVIVKLPCLCYIPTTLYFSFNQAKRITMLYIGNKYKKKFESTNLDWTYLLFLILLGSPVRGYSCSTIHKIVPFTIIFKLRRFGPQIV